MKKIVSRIYLADIVVENEQGYHLEALWYGADPENLARVVLDVMSSWYEPNKEKLPEEIVALHKKLEEATKEPEDQGTGEAASGGKAREPRITFKELQGELFQAGGLSLEVQLTNDMTVLYDFVADQFFEIYAMNGEQPEDYRGMKDLVDAFKEKYDIEEQFVKALLAPNDRTLSEAICLIDMKYHYTQRHFRPQSTEAGK